MQFNLQNIQIQAFGLLTVNEERCEERERANKVEDKLKYSVEDNMRIVMVICAMVVLGLGLVTPLLLCLCILQRWCFWFSFPDLCVCERPVMAAHAIASAVVLCRRDG